MTLGERIGVMKDGRLHQVGDALELYELPKDKFVVGFIGSPPMNFIDGFIKQDAGKIFFVNTEICIPLSAWDGKSLPLPHSASVILGIRPEHILLNPPIEGGLPKFRA